MKNNRRISAFVGCVLCVGAVLMGPLLATRSEARQAALPQTLIIGGTEVESTDAIAATTVLLLGESTQGGFMCTGSIIAEDLVVTAGHCLGDEGDARITIAFRNKLNGTGPKIKAKRALRPTQYVNDPNTQEDMFDIALVHFLGGLPQGYRVAKLLDDATALNDGDAVTLAGFGVDHMSGASLANSGAGTLRKVSVNVKKAKFHHAEVLLDESHGKGSCIGDSGGPAFVERADGLLLFGVTSRGDSRCAREGIYTSILGHQEWVEEAAAALRKGM